MKEPRPKLWIVEDYNPVNSEGVNYYFQTDEEAHAGMSVIIEEYKQDGWVIVDSNDLNSVILYKKHSDAVVSISSASYGLSMSYGPHNLLDGI